MRSVTPLVSLFLLAIFAPLSDAAEPATTATTGPANRLDADTYEMVTDDKESNREFYQALGYEFVPEAHLRDADAIYGAGYCIRLAQRYRLDGKQARFLGLLYVAQHAIAPACYTLQPFTDDLAEKRCGLMHRRVLRNDPATRTLVCGPGTTAAKPEFKPEPSEAAKAN
jgi:hypothetical protein